MYPSLMPQYSTLTFSQVWDSYPKFKADYDEFASLVNGGTAPLATQASVSATFYLLFARYGNTPIVNYDVTQFKMKVMANIATYGPAWERKKALQKSLRDLTEAELLQGAKQIYNHANNPSTSPTTGTLDELDFINDQSTSNNKKSKMEAYSLLMENLRVDATDEYMNKFKNCFCRFVGNQFPTLFVLED